MLFLPPYIPQIPLILVIGNLKFAFLAIKSVKKVDFSLPVLLNTYHLPPGELSILFNVIPLLTDAIGPSHSAFLAIKSVKKANFPPFKLLDQIYLLSSKLSNLPKAIPLLTCAVGVSEPSLFRLFGHKIGQKGEFLSF